ncbi:MAG TPA: sulfatase-like hydrolase/transferase [Casimicrobiaceae bacterium]|nr:sulfatase-like hydrolase/transferase [Casimicrobiaceae bacterium]
MGCSGQPWVQTPSLDRLAARGTRFANAYTPCPVCVPARARLATGRYVHEIGLWDNAIAYDGRVPGWGPPAAGRRNACGVDRQAALSERDRSDRICPPA